MAIEIVDFRYKMVDLSSSLCKGLPGRVSLPVTCPSSILKAQLRQRQAEFYLQCGLATMVSTLWIPKASKTHGKIHHVQWENSLFRHFQWRTVKVPEGRWWNECWLLAWRLAIFESILTWKMLLRGESFATKDQKEMPVSPGIRRFAIDRMYQLAWSLMIPLYGNKWPSSMQRNTLFCPSMVRYDFGPGNLCWP